MNSPTKDMVMAVVAVMVAAEVVEKLATLMTAVPHQAIKVLLRILQTSINGVNKAI
jgi:hypothetical protein